jgi:putative ABC transport system permease protein
MMALAWHTARARSASLVGSFVALALGVALLAAMALTLAATIGAPARVTWFARAAVVVAGDNMVAVPSGEAGQGPQALRTAGARAVPPVLVGPLSALGARTVADYAGYAAVPGAPGRSVHPWPAAALHPYAWVSGGPPRQPGQLVVSEPTRLATGDRVVAATALGPRTFAVSGVLRSPAAPAFYATGAVARRLAGGRIDAIALMTRPGYPAAQLAARARAAAAGAPVRVLTGTGRAAAQPGPDPVVVQQAVALLGTASGVAGFVSVFVVAGTFGYSVSIRRREFGLLRSAGATPRQVRRLVRGEALVVAVPAALAGSAAAVLLAGRADRWLARAGFLPPGFTAHFILWPVAAAFAAGLAVALGGAGLAARRAGRVRPAEALRESAAGRRAMPPLRWAAALAALAGSVPVLAALVAVHSADAAALLLPAALLLVLGAALLTPALAPPLLRLLGAPLAARYGPAGPLAARSAAASGRRTAAIAAPVLLTVGIAGSMLAGTATLTHAQQAATASRIAAPVMVQPSGTAGLADASVAAIRSAPGVAAAAAVTSAPVYLKSGGDPERWDGLYLDGPAAMRLLRYPLVAGRLAALTGSGTVAVPAGTWRLGQTATLWLTDSARVRLRVVAVLAHRIDLEQTVLLPWGLRAGHLAAPLATAVYLRMTPGAGLAGVRAAARAGGGRVTATRGLVAAADAQASRANTRALIVVLGLALVYTVIAIANTLVIATASRRAELAALRLAGATRAQVLRLAGTEAALVAALGTGLAAVITAVTVAAVRRGLAGVAPPSGAAVPWTPLAAIGLVCLVVAVLGSVLTAAAALRDPGQTLAAAAGP